MRQSLPKHIRIKTPRHEDHFANEDNIPKIWVCLTYTGHKGENLYMKFMEYMEFIYERLF